MVNMAVGISILKFTTRLHKHLKLFIFIPAFPMKYFELFFAVCQSNFAIINSGTKKKLRAPNVCRFISEWKSGQFWSKCNSYGGKLLYPHINIHTLLFYCYYYYFVREKWFIFRNNNLFFLSLFLFPKKYIYKRRTERISISW